MTSSSLRLHSFSFAWLAVLLLIFGLFARPFLPLALYEWPAANQISFTALLTQAINGFIRGPTFGDASIMDYTRVLGSALNVPLEWIQNLLAKGWDVSAGNQSPVRIPPISWVGISLSAMFVAARVGGWRLGLLGLSTFVYFAVFRLWQDAMLTVASVLIIVIVGFIIGVGLGVVAWRYSWANRILEPIFDVMQTLPIFSYLVPMILLFGFGPISAIVVTLVFALPPIARATTVALHLVPHELEELSQITGATRLERMFKIYLPSARENILIGLNQMIMATLSMVILASLIGAGGLGGNVLEALQNLRFGRGLEAGFAISLLAIFIYRFGTAISRRRPRHDQRSTMQRDLLIAILLIVAPTVLGIFVEPVSIYPKTWTITTQPYWASAISWLNVTYGDAFEAFRAVMSLYLLKPLFSLVSGFGWFFVGAALFICGASHRRWDLAVLSACFVALTAAIGYWSQLLISFNLVLVGTLIAALVAFPVGIWASKSARARSVIDPVLDTIQTLPALIYLLPVVVLFGPGNIASVFAIATYVFATIVRYTDNALRSVSHSLEEAAVISGATGWQELVLVRLPVALPSIMLGLNQAILLGISMVVVTALVGSTGLERETLAALSRVDPGRGMTAGLILSLMAIIIDRFAKQLVLSRSIGVQPKT